MFSIIMARLYTSDLRLGGSVGYSSRNTANSSGDR
jgi:hypothetical protein